MHTHFYGSKRYHAGRWFVTRGSWRFSAPAYVSPRFLAGARNGTHSPKLAYNYSRRAAFLRELTRDYDPALVQDAYEYMCRKYYRIAPDEFPDWVWVLRYVVEITRQVHLPYSPPPPESYEALLEAQFSGYGDFRDNRAFL